MPVTGEQSLASSGRRRRSTFGRIIRWLPLIGVLTLIAVVYFHYFYRFGEGVKSGHLNYVVRKGNVFKTYEGKLIQQGYKTNLQSNEFDFSIANRRLFDSLSLHSGKILISIILSTTALFRGAAIRVMWWTASLPCTMNSGHFPAYSRKITGCL